MAEHAPLVRETELLTAILKKARFPISALIELTRRCNLRCAHCYLDLDRGSDAPAEMVRRALDDLADAGTLFVTFTGGEMLLHPDWLALARHARHRGFAVRFKTNGTLLEDQDIRHIADLPVVSVHISLYGADPGVHDAVTGRPGSFERTVHTVRRLRARDVNVSLRFPVLETTAPGLDEFVKLSAELGCGYVVDPRINPSLDGGRDTSVVAPNAANLRDMVSLLHLELSPPPDPTANVSVAEDPWPCLRMQSGLYLRADGEIWRCPLLPISFGSVNDGPLPEVWRRSEVRLRLAETARQAPEPCASCDLVWACTRCPAQAWHEHGGLHRPATIDCQLAAARAKGVVADLVTRCDTCVLASHAPDVENQPRSEHSARDDHAGRVT